MIEVQNLVKVYGRHKAVDHLSFSIEKGKVYGFLGPNGAGKSTTMNIMTGYLGATEGTVLIDGHDILKEPEEVKKKIGYLPEQPPLYMEMTVLEYLQFAAELKKIPRAQREQEINRVMHLTKIHVFKDRLIQNLSKGYRQRVGFAQAILGFPEVIILDEPMVGMDPQQIIEIRELIRNLAKDHTVILSSHILAEVREVCDYILIISRGQLVASDTPEHLEEQMGGGSHIKVQAHAMKNAMTAVLKQISGIGETKYTSDKDGVTTAEIACRDNLDLREAIFRAFAQNNIPLLTLMLNKTTLEEVFMELTQTAAPVQPDEKKRLKNSSGRKLKAEEKELTKAEPSEESSEEPAVPEAAEEEENTGDSNL